MFDKDGANRRVGFRHAAVMILIDIYGGNQAILRGCYKFPGKAHLFRKISACIDAHVEISREQALQMNGIVAVPNQIYKSQPRGDRVPASMEDGYGVMLIEERLDQKTSLEPRTTQYQNVHGRKLAR